MAVQLVPRDPQDQWVPGSFYRLTYGVKAPAFVTAEQLQIKVDQAVRQYATDQRLRLIKYAFNRTEGTLAIDVEAIAPASPIIIVAYALLAVGVLVAVTFTIKAVAELLDSGTAKLPGGIKIPFVPILLAAGAFIFLRSQRR